MAVTYLKSKIVSRLRSLIARRDARSLKKNGFQKPVVEAVERRLFMTAEYRGVNDLGTFGFDTTSFSASTGGDMAAWGVSIVREDVPDFDVVPFNTTSIAAPGGGTLHGLGAVVNDIQTNVGASTVTILCPFTWNNAQILGNIPSATSYYSTYLTRLTAEATAFANKSNVWLEVWNEPYTVNNPATWLSDMEQMVSSIRTSTGFTGKIVIPGGDYDGNETPFVNQGQTLINYDPSHNITFDLHAYSNVIQNQTTAQIVSRIQTIVTAVGTGNLIFGEFGPAILGSSGYDDVSPFIAAAEQTHVTAIAWNWNDSDGGTLHNSDGTLNNTSANFNWANQVFGYISTVPTIMTQPSASPNPATGTSTTLSVLGADTGPSGEAGLSYTWSATPPAGAPAPTLNNTNGLNASKSMGVTFHAAGSYTFQVTVTNSEAHTVTAAFTVVVNQTVTSLAIIPASSTITPNSQQQFTANTLDQFGNVVSAVSAVWSVISGGGTVTNTGLYTASYAVGTAVLQAVAQAMTATVSVTIARLTGLPVGWKDADINSSLPAGSGVLNGTTYTVKGGGDNITGGSDQFNYAYATVAGDMIFQARVTGVSTTSATAGVMFRDSTGASAMFAMLDVTGAGIVQFNTRSSTGGSAAVSAAVSTGITPSISTPIWVEIIKSGTSYSAFYATGTASPTTLTQVGSTTVISFTNTSYLAGLAVCSNNTAAAASATFDNVNLVAPFASASSSTLNIMFDATSDPIALISSSGIINVTEDSITSSFTGITKISVILNYPGGDVLTFNGGITAPFTLTNSASTDSIDVTAGVFTLAAPATHSGLMTVQLNSLVVASNASVVLNTAVAQADRNVLILQSLSLAGSTGAWASRLDLGGNDLLIRAGNLPQTFDQLKTGFNQAAGGYWNGQGILSSMAASQPASPTTLGLLQPGSTQTIDGQSVGPADVLIKYTFFGDANLSGTVDGSDYTLVDAGFNANLLGGRATGWQNGDFNYDNKVDGSDYTLMDNAFNTQGGTLALTPQALVGEALALTPRTSVKGTLPQNVFVAQNEAPIANVWQDQSQISIEHLRMQWLDSLI